MPGVAAPGMIAIVVPVFEHSVLVFDAIHSLAPAAHARIVIVDDGCPNLATPFAGLGLAALLPNVTYLRAPNRGLSGARNRGIAHVLGHMPDVEAVYFLDADNMLSDWSLPQMHRMLAQHPNEDWFYPDIRMFGHDWEAEYDGAFTPLVESLINMCEAGSLVRRRVFVSGLRFCEQLQLGFEDWDFWLSAIERGFRGLHFPASGFRYRKRAESMLANATRDQARIRGQLQQRHPWLTDLKWVVGAEHRMVPRYAIRLVDLDVVRLTSSGDTASEDMPWPAYMTRFWSAARSAKTQHAGAIFLVTTSFNLRVLRDARLLAWALFDLEVGLGNANIATVRIGRDAGQQLTISAPEIGPASHAAIAAMSVDTLRSVARSELDDWIRTATSAEPVPRISCRTIDLPRTTPFAAPIGDMLRDLVRACLELRASPFAADSGFPAPDCALGTPDRGHINHMLRAKFGGGVLPPAIDTRASEIAFVLPRFGFGGVERAARMVARALRRRGHVVSLVLLKSRVLEHDDGFTDAFDRIFFLDNQEFENWTGPSYLGTPLSRWSSSGEHANELNLLSMFDAVFACHAGDIMGLMGNLRRQGVVTGSYTHLFDMTETQRNAGHPHIALAFEYALDVFVCCSRDIGLQMHALGVPAAKIIEVPNAAGIDISPQAADASLRAHRARQGQKLNVLFLGRLDPQKGLDRLLAICTQLRQRQAANIRVAGRTVLTDSIEIEELSEYAEPPVHGADLIDAYVWADILLLPSRYEGLPLTVIEAMQLGVVPIVARSGAIAEVIDGGRTGFIVSQDGCVAETLERIAWLTEDRGRLHAMMAAAAASAAMRRWDDAVIELDAALRDLLAKRATARGAYATAK